LSEGTGNVFLLDAGVSAADRLACREMNRGSPIIPGSEEFLQPNQFEHQHIEPGSKVLAPLFEVDRGNQ
jgi:hypothetical protein